MKKLVWMIVAAAVLASSVGAWAYARSNACSESFVCPLTGEEIPECCCPLK